MILQYDPANNSLTKEITSDEYQTYTLVAYNNVLYGVPPGASMGGNVGIFKYNPATNIRTDLVNFTITNGGNSVGSLMLYNNKMYGFRAGLHATRDGTLYEYDPVSNIVSTKIILGSSDFSRPGGQLTYFNKKLYGTASHGGSYEKGGIFEYDMVTGVYKRVFNLKGTNGRFGEDATFTVVNEKFYGMTHSGGENDMGVIYEYDPVADLYYVLHHFSGGDGKEPHGKLVDYNGKLYGTTFYGGLYDKGTIFEFDLATKQFALRVNFDSTRGSHPASGLTLHNGRLFGVASTGGEYDMGTLYEYHPLANALIRKVSFNEATTGSYPRAALVAYKNDLFGVSFLGAVGYNGHIFKYSIASNTLESKHILGPAEGQYAVSGMTLMNDKLYGMTNMGGDLLSGVIYEYDPTLDSYNKKIDFNGHNGRLPRWSRLLQVPALVAPGSAGSCTNANATLINAANSNEWVPFTDPNGRAVAEINANGNILGNVQVRFFINDGNIRQKNGMFYADRNITITAQNPAQTPVSIRFYMQKSEFESLKAINGSGIVAPGDLGMYFNNDFCASQMTGAVTDIPTTVSNWESDYVYSIETTNLSSFYFARSAASLPVHILEFNGRKNGEGNKIEWKASCTNDVDFTVERSINGISFEAIGLIWAQQNDCSKPFSFDDKNPYNRSYYRLKMVERNGPTTYSKIIKLERDSKEDFNAGIYPNPVEGGRANLRIQSSAASQLNYDIVDMAGRILVRKTIQVNQGVNTYSIDVSSLAGGVYHISYNDGKNRGTVRFVKK